jgi:hypothetical protein
LIAIRQLPDQTANTRDRAPDDNIRKMQAVVFDVSATWIDQSTHASEMIRSAGADAITFALASGHGSQ